MIIVIQCASGKRDDAGHLRTLDGRKVMFVARPHDAPCDENLVYGRPDDVSDNGRPWRSVLMEYNADPGDNLLNLLPAWRLYKNQTYRILVDRYGPERLYILSAGWGMIRADFLTPKYDITFSKAGKVEPFKRRSSHDIYEDFGLPPNVAEPVVFFGGRDYIPLFRRLTERVESGRTIFYAGKTPDVEDCRLVRYGDPFTNWHYQCAMAFAEGELRN